VVPAYPIDGSGDGSGNDGGGTSDPTQAADTPISQAEGDIKDLRNLAAKLAGPGASAAEVAKYMELLQSFIKDRNATQDKQTGIGLLGQARRAAQSDPNRAAAQNMMTDILKNPSNLDQQLVRNKYTSNADKSFQANLDALAQSGASRGLAPGGMAGATIDAYRQHSGDVASGLGDLDLRMAAQERAAQYDALNAQDRQYQLYNVGDYNMYSGEAQYLGNPAMPMQSPTAGLTNATMGINAAQAAANSGLSGGQGALTGAVSGAGAGASMGLWGALAGALWGGASGYMNASK